MLRYKEYLFNGCLTIGAMVKHNSVQETNYISQSSKYRIAGKFGELTHFEHLAKESLRIIDQPIDY